MSEAAEVPQKQPFHYQKLRYVKFTLMNAKSMKRNKGTSYDEMEKGKYLSGEIKK